MSLSREQMLKELELLPVWLSNGERPAASARVADVSEGLAPIAAPNEILADNKLGIAPDTIPVLTADSGGDLGAQPALFEKAVAEVNTKASIDELPVEQNVEPVTTELSTAELLVTPSVDQRAKTILSLDWPALQEDVPGCVACNLSQTRTQTVFGVGDPDADWLIIGEAPGAEEDRKGEPFVGMAGQLLDNMLAAIQLQRGKNVYIANVLKCRPPENRDPHGEEVRQCDPYLKRQVELIKPKLILALGKFAAQSLLDSTDTIAALRGRQHSFQGVPVIVTYHPAYLLRNLPDKAKAWEDLCFARATMQALQTAESPQ